MRRAAPQPRARAPAPPRAAPARPPRTRRARAAASATPLQTVDIIGPQKASDPEVAAKRAGLRMMTFSTQPYTTRYFVEPLQAAGFAKLRSTEARLGADTAKIAQGFDAVCLFVNDTCDAEVVEALAELGVKFIAMRCAGYDRVDVAAANAAGIKVVRVPTYSPTSVAEHAVTLMFAINRHITQAINRVTQGNYSLSGLVGRQMGGKTVGVLGTGAIGAEACRLFKGLGMNVLAYDVRPNPAVEAMGIPYQSWEEILPQCDVISLHMPLLPSTHHFINGPKIAMMKPGVTLLNVSRGALIDTRALLDGVRSGRVGGAGLDVYEKEAGVFFQDLTDLQPRERMAYWDTKLIELVALPQVLVTPHTAFLTAEALTNIADTTVDNIDAYLMGKPLTNEVQPPKSA
ncbi:MAG: putative D-lactate dehydrogenase [Monoraphidium minutum]|nr:MAG: putative D-lactate dehydrogenase [Monoraphidium minutum]